LEGGAKGFSYKTRRYKEKRLKLKRKAVVVLTDEEIQQMITSGGSGRSLCGLSTCTNLPGPFCEGRNASSEESAPPGGWWGSAGLRSARPLSSSILKQQAGEPGMAWEWP